MDYIDTVLYSAGEIPADDELIVNAAVVEFVTGSGRKAIIDIDNNLLCKRAIVKIRNTDYSCLPRAIVVGYKHLMTKIEQRSGITESGTIEIGITDVVFKEQRLQI